MAVKFNLKNNTEQKFEKNEPLEIEYDLNDGRKHLRKFEQVFEKNIRKKIDELYTDATTPKKLRNVNDTIYDTLGDFLKEEFIKYQNMYYNINYLPYDEISDELDDIIKTIDKEVDRYKKETVTTKEYLGKYKYHIDYDELSDLLNTFNHNHTTDVDILDRYFNRLKQPFGDIHEVNDFVALLNIDIKRIINEEDETMNSFDSYVIGMEIDPKILPPHLKRMYDKFIKRKPIENVRFAYEKDPKGNSFLISQDVDTGHEDRIPIKVLRVGSGLRHKEHGGNLLDSIKHQLGIKHKMPNHVKSILEKYGDKLITVFKVYRKPLDSKIKKVANLVTLGKLDKNVKKLGYDDLFHLYAILTLDDGTDILIEKNQSVIFKVGNHSDYIGADESKEIKCKEPLKTLPQMVQETITRTSEKSYWTYSVNDYNCQRFILDNLTTLEGGSVPSEISKFILQDVPSLLTGSKYVKLPAQILTDLAGFWDRLIGKGKKKRRYSRY